MLYRVSTLLLVTKKFAENVMDNLYITQCKLFGTPTTAGELSESFQSKYYYQLRITSYVSLKIFDVLGNEVATLVNEKQNQGSYNYQFSTVNYQLASGIYFYTLTAGDFKETKRMLLIK